MKRFTKILLSIVAIAAFLGLLLDDLGLRFVTVNYTYHSMCQKWRLSRKALLAVETKLDAGDSDTVKAALHEFNEKARAADQSDYNLLLYNLADRLGASKGTKTN